MSRYTVADYVVDHLKSWDVERIYGYSGDSINPVVSAINRDGEGIKFVQARHEEMCAFMACAQAKFSGRLGVCLATSGPGAIHLLNGLYDAKMDNQPVLAIVGQPARKALGTSYQQDVDLLSLFKDVAHEYVNVATSPDQVRHLIDRSIITSYTKRTVTCLILPHDIQTAEAKPEPKQERGQSFSGVCFPSTALTAPASEIAKAAAIINSSERVAILIGAGAMAARDQVVALAELTRGGVAKALLGKAVLEDSLPYVTGSIGLLGTEATSHMMQNCDALLMLGTNFPYAEYLPKPGQAKGIQIDLNPANLSLRYPMDVALIGDCASTLDVLLPMLEQKTDLTWISRVEKWVEESEKVLTARTEAPANPVNPEKVFAALSTYLPEDVIVTCDSGTSTVWYARHLKMRRGMMASVSGALASMGCSIPYAIGAKFAFPNRPVVVCTGDGAMQMAGNNELLTIKRYWREWADPRLIIVVLKNNDLNFVTWEMRSMEGNPRFAASQDIPDFDYAAYARLIGFEGYTISDPEQIQSVMSQAFDARGPVLIEVISDPDIPPIPSTVTFEMGATMASALSKEGTEAAGPVMGAIKTMWQSIAGK